MSSGANPFALVNGRVILPDRVLAGHALVIQGATIQDLPPQEALPPEMPRVDVGGRLISPGLIDIHTHGALGHTFNEPTPQAFAAITQENLRRGVTGLLATTATAPIQDLAACLAMAREWIAGVHPQAREGAQVLGVHVEGPYFSPAQAGAQDPAHLRTPDDGSVEQLLAFHDVIRILTFAPELPGALALTRRLLELGIVPGAGHSNATEEEALPAIDAGLRHMIHIWSGQSTTVREGPWRKPGLLELSLTDERLTVEMIADNRHLPRTLMRLAVQCIGPERLCLVSDATSGAGLPEGARFRMGEMEYQVHDGVGMMLDRSAFAGSTTLLSQMIPVMTQVVGVPLHQAVGMASLNPARVIGLEERKGSLEPGKDADVVVFEENFEAWKVWVRGREVMSHE